MMTMIMTTNFSEIKKQGRIKGFKIWGWERNKVFGQNIYHWCLEMNWQLGQNHKNDIRCI